MIFTNKYTGSVIETLNAMSTEEEVKRVLGEPSFDNGSSLYGYIGESAYVFFDFSNSQISIYPVIKISDDEAESFKELITQMNKDFNIKQFAMDLTSLWTDYDSYNFDSNYVDLRYTLRGVRLYISSNSLDNGIFIYQNYSNSFDIQDLENVYVSDEDMVFEAEKTRKSSEALSRVNEGDYTEEELKELGTKFTVRFKSENTGPMFYSIDESHPDNELDSRLKISSWNWYDDYNFIYSVDDDGIYLYNCISFKNIKIKDISEDITINTAGDRKDSL